MASAETSSFNSRKAFKLSIISYLTEKVHCEMTANIELHFVSHYQHRLQMDLKGRGLYGVTDGELEVNCAISGFHNPSEEDPSKKDIFAQGDAFIILHDELTLEEAEKQVERILREDRGKMIPVFRKMIETKAKRGKISLGCECCQSPRDVLFADIFEKLCVKVKLDAGFIAPPKKATKFEKTSRFQRVVNRVKRRISIC